MKRMSTSAPKRFMAFLRFLIRTDGEKLKQNARRWHFRSTVAATPDQLACVVSIFTRCTLFSPWVTNSEKKKKFSVEVSGNYFEKQYEPCGGSKEPNLGKNCESGLVLRLRRHVIWRHEISKAGKSQTQSTTKTTAIEQRKLLPALVIHANINEFSSNVILPLLYHFREFFSLRRREHEYLWSWKSWWKPGDERTCVPRAFDQFLPPFLSVSTARRVWWTVKSVRRAPKMSTETLSTCASGAVVCWPSKLCRPAKIYSVERRKRVGNDAERRFIHSRAHLTRHDNECYNFPSLPFSEHSLYLLSATLPSHSLIFLFLFSFSLFLLFSLFLFVALLLVHSSTSLSVVQWVFSLAFFIFNNFFFARAPHFWYVAAQPRGSALHLLVIVVLKYDSTRLMLNGVHLFLFTALEWCGTKALEKCHRGKEIYGNASLVKKKLPWNWIHWDKFIKNPFRKSSLTEKKMLSWNIMLIKLKGTGHI